MSNALAKARARLSQPCRCGSGNYCRRHLRYGLPPRERRRIEVDDPVLGVDQPCGGGRRVIRSPGSE